MSTAASTSVRPQAVPRLLPQLTQRAVTAGIRLAARGTPWLERELLGLRYVVGPGAVCLDVGAAAGLYTAELARLVGPSGTVHSIEPLPFAHPTISRVLGLRVAGNVRRHQVALGRSSGHATMSVPLRRGRLVTGRSFLTAGATGLGSNDEFGGQAEFRVETDRLDHFCARAGIARADFLKIDVEGAELDVLAGGTELVERWRPALLLEIEARHLTRFGRTPQSVVDWLTSRGYRMSVWHGGAWQPTDRVTDGFRNYLFRARHGAA